MPITTQQLLQTFPNAGASVFALVLNVVMGRFQIVGNKRMAWT